MILRYILAGLIGLYFAANAVLARALIDFKLHGVRPDPASHRWAPVLADMGNVQSGFWLVGVALYGLATVLLAARRRGAALAFAGGVTLDFLNWRLTMTHPSYSAVLGPGQAMRDTWIFVVLVLIGVAVWWTERRARA